MKFKKNVEVKIVNCPKFDGMIGKIVGIGIYNDYESYIIELLENSYDYEENCFNFICLPDSFIKHNH